MHRDIFLIGNVRIHSIIFLHEGEVENRSAVQGGRKGQRTRFEKGASLRRHCTFFLARQGRMVRKTTHISLIQFLNAALDDLEKGKKEHELLRCTSTKPINPMPSSLPPSTDCLLPLLQPFMFFCFLHWPAEYINLGACADGAGRHGCQAP